MQFDLMVQYQIGKTSSGPYETAGIVELWADGGKIKGRILDPSNGRPKIFSDGEEIFFTFNPNDLLIGDS